MNNNLKTYYKKCLKISPLVCFICVAIFVSLFLYRLWISEYMTRSLVNQLQGLGTNINGTIELNNIWGAEKIVACKGYLDTSKQLEKDLLEAGLNASAATEIAEDGGRCGEGTHFYLVKGEKMLYFHNLVYPIYMEGLNKDFICINIGKKIYINVAQNPAFRLESIR